MKPVNPKTIVASLVQWFDADYHAAGAVQKIRDVDRVNWLRCTPFVILHLGCLAVFSGRLELDRGMRCRRTLFGADVRYHRYLSPLFFAPYL